MTRRIPPVRRLLIKAKRLIQKPENWIKGPFAMSAKGRSVLIGSPKACRFCSYGAVLRAEGEPWGTTSSRATALLDEQTPEGMGVLNDDASTTHPMVMRLFNKAIRRAKEQRI